MGNENSGWHKPENGGTHVGDQEVLIQPNTGFVKAIVFTPTSQTRENIAKEIRQNDPTKR
jgi:hypothetical protein